MKRAADLTGQKFNKLTVVSRAGSTKWGAALWLCGCDCGGEATYTTSQLKASKVSGCGCGAGAYLKAKFGAMDNMSEKEGELFMRDDDDYLYEDLLK